MTTAILQAINDIPDEYLHEYAQYKAKPNTAAIVKRWVAAAACIAVIVCGILLLPKAQMVDPRYTYISTNEELAAVVPDGHFLSRIDIETVGFSGMYDPNHVGLEYDADLMLGIEPGFTGTNFFFLYTTFRYPGSIESYVDSQIQSVDYDYSSELITVGGQDIYIITRADYYDEVSNTYFCRLVFTLDGDLYNIDYSAEALEPLLHYLEAWFAMAQ